jgi:hypothetical protein
LPCSHSSVRPVKLTKLPESITEEQYPEAVSGSILPPRAEPITDTLDNLVYGGFGLRIMRRQDVVIAMTEYGKYGPNSGLAAAGLDAREAVENLAAQWDQQRRA